MTSSKKAVFAALLILFMTGLYAQEEGEPQLNLRGFRSFWWGIVPTGLDFNLSVPMPTRILSGDTDLYFQTGGGYEEETLYRNADGSLIRDTSSFSEGNNELKFRSPNFSTETGLIQGIIPSKKDSNAHKNLLEGFFLYRSRLALYYDPEVSDTIPTFFQNGTRVFSDSNGLFSNSVIAGVSLNNRTMISSRFPQGIYAEASAEWAPYWFGNETIGLSDYYRFNIKAEGFLQLPWLIARNNRNILLVYGVGYFSADWSEGEDVPYFVMTSSGGRFLKPGLGWAVRGFEEGAFDSKLKISANIELRAAGPELIRIENLTLFKDGMIPVFFTFLDSGYYYGFENLPEDSEDEDACGFLLSAGAGWAVEYSYPLSVTFYFAAPLYGSRLDSQDWVFTIDFGFHI